MSETASEIAKTLDELEEITDWSYPVDQLEAFLAPLVSSALDLLGADDEDRKKLGSLEEAHQLAAKVNQILLGNSVNPSKSPALRAELATIIEVAGGLDGMEF